jgi:hypothetical protein
VPWDLQLPRASTSASVRAPGRRAPRAAWPQPRRGGDDCRRFARLGLSPSRVLPCFDVDGASDECPSLHQSSLVRWAHKPANLRPDTVIGEPLGPSSLARSSILLASSATRFHQPARQQFPCFGQVHHRRYPLHRAEAVRSFETMVLSRPGCLRRKAPQRALYSPGRRRRRLRASPILTGLYDRSPADLASLAILSRSGLAC